MINTISKLWPRIGAFFLDTIFLGLIGQLLGLVLYDTLAALNNESILVGLIISLIYFTIGYSKVTNGQTIGKKIMRIKVVDNNNLPLNFQKGLLRAFILTAPYFLVNYPIPFILEDSIINLYKSLILGFTVLYLVLFVFFNKSTRQSLHDLLVGSYVVDAHSVSIKTIPNLNLKTAQVFFGIMGGLLILSIAFYSPKNDGANSSITHLEKVRIELENLPGVITSSVSKNTTTFISDNRKVTNSLSLSLKTGFKPSFNNPDSKHLIDKAVSIAFNNYDSINQIDKIKVKLYNGFTIGISKWSNSITDVKSTFELMYPDSVITEMISQEEITDSDNWKPTGEKNVVQTHHPNGKLASETTYYNEIIEGETNTWYENGNLESSIEYKKGMRHGLTLTYYENGITESELIYENNILKQVIGRYDVNGKKLEVEN